MASNFLEQWRKSGRKINHSGFDLSTKKVFHSPFGLIQQPLFAETNPNEHFELNVDGFMRTETMNTAAFADGKLITSLFFVPYSQLWHNFNSFVSQKDDRHSSAYKGLNFVPTFHLFDLHMECFRMYVTRRILEEYCLCNDSGKDSYMDDINIRNAAKTLYREYVHPPLSSSPNTFFWRYVADIHGVPYVDNLIRCIQFYKFGSPYLYLGWFDKEFEDAINRIPADDRYDFALVAGVIEDAYDSTVDRFFGVNTDTPSTQVDSMFWHKYQNLFRPAAYQHIFYDFFRNKYFDELPYYQYDVEQKKVRYIDTFNFDDLECDTFEHSVFDFLGNDFSVDGVPQTFAYSRFLCLFDMHYRQYKHDIYTSALNATQFGAVSSISFDGTPDITFDQNGNFILGSRDGKLSKEDPVSDDALKDISFNTMRVLSWNGEDAVITNSPFTGLTLKENYFEEPEKPVT